LSQDNGNDLAPPKPTTADALHKVGEMGITVAGGIATVFIGAGGIGSVLGKVFTAAIKPPLAKRTEQWMTRVSERILRLEQDINGFSIDQLANRPFFVTSFLQASQIAIRTHQEEKLTALQNAVINIARPIFPEDDIYIIFLNWIDSFTAWHIRTLFFLNERHVEQKEGRLDTRYMTENVVDALISNFPELLGNRDFCAMIIKDLVERGLLSAYSPDLKVVDRDVYSSYTTKLGKQFLDFISES
jgi:hypothetical protein